MKYTNRMGVALSMSYHRRYLTRVAIQIFMSEFCLSEYDMRSYYICLIGSLLDAIKYDHINYPQFGGQNYEQIQLFM